MENKELKTLKEIEKMKTLLLKKEELLRQRNQQIELKDRLLNQQKKMMEWRDNEIKSLQTQQAAANMVLFALCAKVGPEFYLLKTEIKDAPEYEFAPDAAGFICRVVKSEQKADETANKSSELTQ